MHPHSLPPASARASVRFKPLLSLSGCLALALIGGCASRPDTVALRAPNVLERLTPYRVDIQQGNVVTRDQLALIKPGMPREDVRDILGSPMLTDVFHANRWDFVFVSQRSGSTDKSPTRLAVAVHFKNGVVERVVAPELPTEHQFVAGMVDRRAPAPKVPALELTQAQRDKLPLPVRGEAAASPQPQGPARSYPPLEPR